MTKIIAVTLALAFAALVNVYAATEESYWGNWGTAPYAASLDEACRKASVAIDGFNLPSAVKEKFKKQVTDTACKGEKSYLTPKMVLEEMWTGGVKPHVMNKKTVAELPVTKSPEGRPYNEDSIVEAAVAYSWTVVHEGRSHYLFLPLVCYNWSWSSLANYPASQPAPVSVVTTTAGCTKEFYMVFVHVWSCKALPSELCKKVEKLIARAEARDTKNATDANAYKPPSVSRSLYDELIREPVAKIDLRVKVQTLNPQTLKVEEDLGELDIVQGIGRIELAETQRAKIVETIWPDYFRSPTMSGGKRRIWLFDEEWRKPGGGNWCIKHVSGLVH